MKIITKIVSKIGWVVLPILLFLFSCNKEDDITDVDNINEIKIPENFPDPVYNYDNNPYTNNGFELGRKLFYDKNLSADKKISCASCHRQSFAFSDPGNAVSQGVEGREGRRNSPAMFNLLWHESFMWDGGVNHIEVMPLAPLQEPDEMDMSLNEILSYLNENNEYSNLFKNVFDTTEISSQQLLFALTQFMGALVSSNSKYDKVQNGEESFNSEEFKGYNLFKDNCVQCHTEPLFTDNQFHNNGLDNTFNTDDLGRFEITQNPNDSAKFKTPSIRNIALTYPYMHDGRFSSLEEVIEFYSSGISSSSSLDENLPVGGFDFTSKEKQALLSFLNTLTDWDFVYDIRFSDPN